MFTNNKFKQLDAVAEMIKGIADADAKVKMHEMRSIIAGHNRMEVPVVENLAEASTGNAFDTKNNPFKPATKPGETAGFDSKKVSTGTVYQKTYKKEPTQKDEAVDPTVTTTDTLAGRVSGGAPNQHSSFKVKLKSEEMEKEELVGKQHKLDKNKNGKLDSQDFKMLRKEEEELEEAKFDPLKHVKNPSPAVKTAAKDVKRSSYADRVAVMKAGGVKDDRGPRGVTQEEVELDEGTMTHITLGKKVKNDEGGHDQDVHYKGKKIGSIDSYKHRTGLRYGGKHDATGDMDAGSRSPEEAIDFVRSSHAEHLKSMKEEVEELDELSKSTLGSYAKKASLDSVMRMGKAATDGDHKEAEKAGKRYGNVVKAVDRLTKEEVQIDEAKSNYELYHPQYSGAIHHALAHHASKAGLSVHDDDYHHHVSIGPRKPAEGASVSHSLPATDEKGGKHMIHMQIYNRGGDKKPYELNTYSSKIAKTSGRTMKEDTELDERTLSPAEKDALEVNVKSMKKNLAGFKARYGKDAKSVMYATATKQAKKD